MDRKPGRLNGSLTRSVQKGIRTEVLIKRPLGFAIESGRRRVRQVLIIAHISQVDQGGFINRSVVLERPLAMLPFPYVGCTMDTPVCPFENDLTPTLSSQLEEWLEDRYGASMAFVFDGGEYIDLSWEEVCAADGFFAHWSIRAASSLPVSAKVALVSCSSSLVGWKVYVDFPEEEWESVLSACFEAWVKHEKDHLAYGHFDVTPWHQNKLFAEKIPPAWELVGP